MTRVEGTTTAPEVGVLVHDLRAGLAAAADPAAAPAMQAHEVGPALLRRPGLLPPGDLPAAIAAHPLPDRAAWLAAVGRLWDEATHREELYAALAVLGTGGTRSTATPRCSRSTGTSW